MREPSGRADGLYDELLPKLAGTWALTPRERAALDFAEGLAAARPSVDDALMARLREVFTDAEIVELGFAAGGFLMLGPSPPRLRRPCLWPRLPRDAGQ